MSEAAPVNLKLVLGPVVVSGLVNAFLFGIVVVQFLDYYAAKFKDGRLITALVVWVGVVDFVTTCTSSSLLWHYFVDNFSNSAAAFSTPWQYNMIPIFSSFISVPVQHFLGYRIYRFSESRILFAFFSLLSLGQAGLAFASSIGALLAPNVEENRKLIPVADSWLALAVACDGGITLMLSYYLSKSRTGRRATDRAISKLIRTSVETALPVTLFCICDLATLTSLPNSNLHLMFALPMARLYTNTLMTTLNTRSTIRKNLVNNGFSSFFPQTNQDETIRFRVEGQKDTLGSTQNDEDQTNDNRGNAMKLRVSAEGNADHWVRSKPNHQTEECELSPL